MRGQHDPDSGFILETKTINEIVCFWTIHVIYFFVCLTIYDTEHTFAFVFKKGNLILNSFIFRFSSPCPPVSQLPPVIQPHMMQIVYVFIFIYYLFIYFWQKLSTLIKMLATRKIKIWFLDPQLKMHECRNARRLARWFCDSQPSGIRGSVTLCVADELWQQLRHFHIKGKHNPAESSAQAANTALGERECSEVLKTLKPFEEQLLPD